MLALIKKNPALATGILLPGVLVVLFSIAALIPRILVERPQYDLLFSIKSYSMQGEHEYKFAISDGKLEWHARKLPASKGSGGYNYRLYWYEAAKKTVHEIMLPEPKHIRAGWNKVPLEETKHWRLSPELIAPDGYRLHNDYKRTSDLGLLFFSGSQRSAIHIKKDGRIVSVLPPRHDRNINTPEFIGWVIERIQLP